ncbi:MAG: IF-2-associated domain-containing protein, partial [Alphaproteobacteria bacterium]|nr:IF-2-associated domain-containing protein [Alphaproteobacteria bacterium]
MTDETDKTRPQTPGPAGAGATRAPLTLKPRVQGAVSSGMVKQSFSHGRTKTVVVETKRRRVEGPVGATPPRPAVETPAPAAA